METSYEITLSCACTGHYGEGHWEAMIAKGNETMTLSGHMKKTSLNQIGLIAAINALTVLPARCTAVIYTDSSYLQKGITKWIERWKCNNWKTKDGNGIRNREYWQRLDEARKVRNITFRYSPDKIKAANRERSSLIAEHEMDHIKGILQSCA